MALPPLKDEPLELDWKARPPRAERPPEPEAPLPEEPREELPEVAHLPPVFKAPPKKPVTEERVDGFRHVKRIVGLIAVLTALTLLLIPRNPPPMLLHLSAGLQGFAPCRAKKQCLLIYLAPYSNVCEEALPFVRELQLRGKSSAKVGVVVLLGQSDRSDLEKMARDFPEPTFVDADGALGKAMQISTLPAWVTVDNAGKVLAKASGDMPEHELGSRLRLESW